MLPAFLFYAALVTDVRALIAGHDLANAQRAARAYQSQVGSTPELAAALSWIARGSLESRQLDQAEKYAAESRKLALTMMATRAMDADPWLPTALGASIEVQAQVLAARGSRSEAVSFLREEAAAYGSTSIGERIRKNLNLLSLEGKPAPALESPQWLGPKPTPWAQLRGKPVLLFFWAHWCPDCKAEEAVLASMMKAYGPKGLKVIAPTKLYGYVAGGEPAGPAVEKTYIEHVRQQYYPAFAEVSQPLSAANFLAYGASTTPTIVLIDAAGVVRLYHPGAISEQELSARIQKILGSR